MTETMKRSIVFLIFFINILCLSAQIEISREIVQYNGKPFYVHEVKQGQTVYSIAKAYGVSTDAVFEVNAFAKEGIQPGQLLKIPAPENISAEPTVTTPILEVVRDTVFLLTYVADDDILLSQIAKTFNINIADIYRFNADFQNREIVRKNEILKLAVNSVDIIIDYLLKKPHAQVIMLVSHEVVKGETVFSIGRSYGCSKDELISMNPGIDEKIKIGQLLWVPSKEYFVFSNFSDRLPEPECRKITTKAHYNIAMLVPFYLDHSGSIVIHSDPKKNANKFFKSFDYIQFYEGFMLALESIDFNNSTFTVQVYDVSEGEEKINTLISRGLLDVDLIIGPFFRKPLEKLSEYSKDKKINVLDLYLPEDVDYNLSNPYLLSAIPSISEQIKGMLLFIKNFEVNKNVIVVYNENNNERILADKIRALQAENPEYEITFCSYTSSGMSGLVNLLSMDKQNIIISFTNNEVFLNTFTRSLFDNAEKYPVTLFGLPTWLRFESIDQRYLNHFNTHFFSSQFVDYSKGNVKTFISAFQTNYLTDPNRMAFLGYDVATYFLGILSHFGNDFPYCTNSFNPELLSTKFIFELPELNGQLRNMHVEIYEIIDFQLFDSKRIPKIQDE